MKSKELTRATLSCTHDELRILLYLASHCNYGKQTFTCQVYHKPVKLRLGQVMPAYIPKLSTVFRIDRRQVHRILVKLEKKGFIKRDTFVRGGKNAGGYTLITVGLISGVPPFVTAKSLETIKDTKMDVPASDPLSYKDNNKNIPSGEGLTAPPLTPAKIELKDQWWNMVKPRKTDYSIYLTDDTFEDWVDSLGGIDLDDNTLGKLENEYQLQLKAIHEARRGRDVSSLEGVSEALKCY